MKGKKFNILDIFIVAIILLSAVVVLVVFKGSSDTNEAETKKVSYTVMAENVSGDVQGLITVGEKIYNSSNYDYLGVLKSVKIESQMGYNYNIVTGKYDKYEVPDKYCVYLEIEGNGLETDTNITVEGTEIKVGKFINVKGKGYAFGSYIVDISLLKD